MAAIGGQPGNQNAIKAKRWSQAIDRALAKRSKAEGIEALDALAEQFLDAVAKEGVNGFRELGDRLEGKPSQEIQHSGDLHVSMMRTDTAL